MPRNVTNEFRRILAHKTEENVLGPERLDVSLSYTVFRAFPVPSVPSPPTVSSFDLVQEKCPFSRVTNDMGVGRGAWLRETQTQLIKVHTKSIFRLAYKASCRRKNPENVILSSLLSIWYIAT